MLVLLGIIIFAVVLCNDARAMRDGGTTAKLEQRVRKDINTPIR